MPKALTVDDLLQSGRRSLSAAGVDSPAKEARLLLALAKKCDPVAIIGKEAEFVSSEVEDAFSLLIERRTQREPFAHLARAKEFFGLQFLSDHRALIPRADSEIVIEVALSVLPKDQALTIADLGTGTGCLMISILKNRPLCRGVAIEKSEASAELANENIQKHGLENRMVLLQKGWEDWDGWGYMDMIVSNPPYIQTTEIHTLMPDVRDFEPHEALDGGADGLDAYKSIVSLANKKMRPNAALVLEIGHDQKNAVQSLLRGASFANIQTAKDLAGKDRVVWAFKCK